MVYVKGFEETYADFERIVREGEQKPCLDFGKIFLYNSETDKFDIELKKQDDNYRAYIMQKFEALISLATITKRCKNFLRGLVEILYKLGYPPGRVISPIAEFHELFDPVKAEGIERALYNKQRGAYGVIIKAMGADHSESIRLLRSFEEWENQINTNYQKER